MNNLIRATAVLAVLIAVFGCVAIVAEDSDAEGTVVHVSENGDDTSGDGSEEKPFATVNRAVESIETKGTVKILSDFTMDATKTVTIPKEKTITLDMNGKMATAAANFSGDLSGRYITNYGTLTITGNGTFEDNDVAGYQGPVTNRGTLTVENGTFHGNTKNEAAHFWNWDGATAKFNGGTYEGAVTIINAYYDSYTYINGGTYTNSWYPAIDNSGHMEIRGGTFNNYSCSSCNEPAHDGHKPWGYTIRSGVYSDEAYLLVDEAEGCTINVTGVQGALTIVGGSANIKNGCFKTVACNEHPGGQTSYYALYVASNADRNAEVDVTGGTFETAHRSAVKVGDDDDSIKQPVEVRIEGGTFTAPDGKSTIESNQYNTDDATITGGEFLSGEETDTSIGQYLDPLYSMDPETGEVSFDQTKVAATVDGESFPTLEEAVSAAGAGDTVIIANDITESIIISGKDIVLDLGTHTLTNTAGEHTITVESGATLTIQGNGTIDNTSNGKAALYNEGNVTMKSGTLTRSVDTKGCTWYTLCNDGTMTIDGGTVRSDGDASSLIVNGLNKAATMTVNDGTFYKKAFNCFKNEENGAVTINGGTFEGVGFAFQNWNTATINGGTFNNIVSSVTYGTIPSSTLTINNGTFNGEVNSWNMTHNGSAAANSPAVTIVDGDFHGRISMLEGEEGKATSTSDPSKASVTVSGGTFDIPPESYMMKNGLTLTKNPDGTYGVAESVTVTFDLPSDSQDKIVEIPKGTVIPSADIPTAPEGYAYTWKVDDSEWDPSAAVTGNLTVEADVRITDVGVTLTVKDGYVLAEISCAVIVDDSKTKYKWAHMAYDDESGTTELGTSSYPLAGPGLYGVQVTVFDTDGISGTAEAVLSYSTPDTPETSFDIEHDGDSASVDVIGDTVIITSSGEHDDVDITLGFVGTADIEINGSVGSGVVTVTAKPMADERVEEALTDLIPDTAVTEDIRGVDVTVSNVDEGYGMWIKVKMDGLTGDDSGKFVASAIAYYIDKNGNREQVDCYVQGTEVWIHTDHNTEYVVIPTAYSATAVTEDLPAEEPDDDSEFPPFIPFPPQDDGDPIEVYPSQDGGSSGGRDDTMKVVAVAAAAVIAAILAIVLVSTYRKN